MDALLVILTFSTVLVSLPYSFKLDLELFFNNQIQSNMTSSKSIRSSGRLVSTSRKLKVYYAFSDNRFSQNYNYPVIRLAGKYLRTFGFEIGTHVQVDLTDSQIVIRKITA